MTKRPDLNHFWTAIHVSEGMNLPLEAVLEREYFGLASSALAQYSAWSRLTAQNLAAAYLARPGYFLTLRERPDQLEPLFNLQPLFARLKTLLPDAVSARVHLLMGDFSCAGTVGPGSILLGLEFLPAENVRHLAPSGVTLLDANQLPAVLAHELIHVQQLERFPDLGAEVPHLTLLQLALLEGAAEYLGALLSGQRANREVHSYGVSHAEELWPLFWAQADAPDWSDWFYSVPAWPGLPGDLGYFMGYELCRAHHERHASEQTVIADIVQSFRTPERFRALL